MNAKRRPTATVEVVHGVLVAALALRLDHDTAQACAMDVLTMLQVGGFRIVRRPLPPDDPEEAR